MIVITTRFIAKKKWIVVIKIPEIRKPKIIFSKKSSLFLFNKIPKPEKDIIEAANKELKKNILAIICWN